MLKKDSFFSDLGENKNQIPTEQRTSKRYRAVGSQVKPLDSMRALKNWIKLPTLSTTLLKRRGVTFLSEVETCPPQCVHACVREAGEEGEEQGWCSTADSYQEQSMQG